MQFLKRACDGFVIGQDRLVRVPGPPISVAEVAKKLLVVRRHLDRFFKHGSRFVILLQEKIGRA